MTRAVVPIKIIDEPFNYGALAPGLADDLRLCAERIRTSISKTVDTVIAIGNELLTAREKLDHGQFMSWVEDGIGIQPRTARNYMNAARFAEARKRETISLLRPAALYQLASPSTPSEVVKAVLERIEAGEVISEANVVTTVKNARRQQRRIDRDAEAGRRRTKKYKEEQQALLQRHQDREMARKATCLEMAKSIHQRLGTETCIWLQKALRNDSWEILHELEQLIGGDGGSA
jgi:hypothetical protein